MIKSLIVFAIIIQISGLQILSPQVQTPDSKLFLPDSQILHGQAL